MRIYGPNGTTAAGTAPAARRTPSGAFSLDPQTTTQSAAPASGTRILGGIDALIALQGFEEPGERRRRAVKRGRAALDALDSLKLGLLSGNLDTAALAAHADAVGAAAGAVGVVRRTDRA